MKNSSLVIIDLQNDFCPGGALPIVDGDKIVPNINNYISIFVKKGFCVFATRDWHPQITSHFKKDGGTWPVHCVQDSKGAEFHPGLFIPEETIIISAGMFPNEDGYSWEQ